MAGRHTIRVKFYDAHNHLQDERLAPYLESYLSGMGANGIERVVVNGSCEEDWPAVLALAKRNPRVVPSFGYHPWYIRERTDRWVGHLEQFLDEVPSAVGEVGLDKWIKNHDLEDQERVLSTQLQLASSRNLPVSIHCLQAWGRLLEILRRSPLPARGFVLHSFGGPMEMIEELAGLGAYFSLPGYFAHARKDRQREAFRHVPLDRLLIETDAPDQSLPLERVRFPLPANKDGKPINHPGNLAAVYEFGAELLQTQVDELAVQVEANFNLVFGGL
jgi:TatD DNase family protein